MSEVQFIRALRPAAHTVFGYRHGIYIIAEGLTSIRYFLITLVAASGVAFLQSPPGSWRPTGFSASKAERQAELEKLFAGVPDSESARRHHRALTERPHVAGEASQRRVAAYVAEQFREAGIPSRLVEYEVLLSYPQHSRLRLLEPVQAELSQRLAQELPYADQVIAPFHAYGASGKVSELVVYANYGLAQDYEKLDDLGISVSGRIVLVRYGRSFRGVKVRLAEQHGARAILIYSDPFDDGYFKGDLYPEGPMRPPTAVQRGSVQFLFLYPGDPLTPGRGATRGVERLDVAEAGNLPSIPSHPLSYEAATEILETLKGPNVPTGWQGALPFAYHIGPGPARVEIEIENSRVRRTITDVIGEIKGAVEPDKLVIAGNHIDAWTYGGVDPNSGTTALIEVARGLGRVLQAGYRPDRTIILAGWDGEEFGLIGSTEWGEQNRERLSGATIAYLNVDAAVSGKDFSASAVPSLQQFIRECASAVTDPSSGESVLELWSRSSKTDNGPSGGPEVGPLGSGSDYTVFLDHLGIASVDMGFRGPYGVYHSVLDNHEWMERFGDPQWQYHPTIARLLGLAILRLANAEVLPFDFEAYGNALAGYLEEVEREASGKGMAIDWEPVRAEISRMQAIGREVNEGRAALLERSMLEHGTLQRINQLTIEVEGAFLLQEGLAERPWFKHALFAPGLNTGYASQPFPGIAGAIRRHPAEAGQEAGRVLAVLKRANQKLDQIRRLTR